MIHSPTWPGRSPSGWARNETSGFAWLNHIKAASAFNPCSRHSSTFSMPLTRVESASRSICVQPNPPSPAASIASSNKPRSTSACSAFMPPRRALSTTATVAASGHCDGSMRVLRTESPLGVRSAKENAVRSWVTDTKGPAAQPSNTAARMAESPAKSGSPSGGKSRESEGPTSFVGQSTTMPVRPPSSQRNASTELAVRHW